MSSFPRRSALLAAGLVLPVLAGAQEPAALPFEQVAATIKPGTWTWTAKLTANGAPQEFGTRTLTLQKAKVGTGWLLLDAQSNAMVTMSDSLVLAAADLGAVSRSLNMKTPMGDASLAMTFTADSVKGALNAPGQSQTIATRNVKGALTNDGVLLLALGRLPLSEKWSGRVELLNPQSGATMPLTLAVKGSEKVTVPAGAFDTWVVESTGGPAALTFYVAKGGPVVRLVQAVPQMGGTMESVLQKP
ncbi:hypothetical protein [Roseisolibacter agri]|uniref:DUF3108 domain-containing protein n=1 Tax=Roseisolibacter agri TaxID=2014610 RepID=A0AA37QER5_9BACT|nr:hypothetical protein [Roseisolibacter agri]GLC27516.1 hypothetical protein rosag_40290 [Roseisolibacter agri]